MAERRKTPSKPAKKKAPVRKPAKKTAARPTPRAAKAKAAPTPVAEAPAIDQTTASDEPAPGPAPAASETADVGDAELPPPPPPPPPARPQAKSGGFTAFLAAVVVGAGLGAGGFFSWPLWSDYVTDYIPPALLPGASEQPTVAGLADRIEALETQARHRIGEDKALARLESERTRLRDELTGLMARLESVEGAVGAVKQIVDATNSTAPAEASGTLKLLSDRLTQLEEEGGSLDDLRRRISQLEVGTASSKGRAASQAVEIERRLSSAVAEIESRLADLERQPPTSVGSASEAPATVLAVSQLRKTVEAGRPFAEDLAALSAISDDDPAMRAATALLKRYAEAGAPTLAALRDRFQRIAGEIVRAAKALPENGWVERVANRIAGLVTLRRVDGGGEENVDSLVATAENRLAEGDLGAAIESIEKLNKHSGPATAVAAPWLADARARLDVERAMTSLHVYAVTLLAPVKE